MPTFSHSLVVNAPQSEIFAILDDVRRTPEWLTRCTGIDKMMDVSVDFVALSGKADGTTSLTHTIDIRTKGFGKIFGPIIRRTLPKQTTDAMNRLKALAES